MVHSGLDEQAAASRNASSPLFEAAGVDTIVINAAGCGSTMKEYGHLLRDDPAWAARAAAFAARCKDISEVLLEACHHRAARSLANPRGLSRRLPPSSRAGHPSNSRASCSPEFPSFTVEEIAEASLCCGSAGVYNLLHPETADELGDRKVNNLLSTGAEAVVSARIPAASCS